MVDIDKAIFVANLDRLMTQGGYTNASLGRNLGVSRQLIWSYRHGKALPIEEKLTRLTEVFKCPRSAFTEPHVANPMLSLQRWAKRENIPYARAVDLFRLGILSGAVVTPQQVFVAPDIHAPEQSKRLVLLAKRRPEWVDAFTANFEAYMIASRISNDRMARALAITVGAVVNWRTGASYPTLDKLPRIAKLLGCSFNDLMICPVARRPTWVAAFAANLDAYMVLYQIENHEIANLLKVAIGAVAKWREGSSYPLFSQLPIIAKALGCSPDELIARAPLAQRNAAIAKVAA